MKKYSVLISGKVIEVNKHDFLLLQTLSKIGVKFTLKKPRKPKTIPENSEEMYFRNNTQHGYIN